MKKYNGFVWIETLVSLSIVLLLAIVVIPVYSTLLQEKKVLHDRQIISLYLYNKLQQTIYENKDEKDRIYNEQVSNHHVTVRFEIKGELIKGCVSWKNVKKRDEQICLYGIPET